jgi:hypothetical protein
MKLEASFPSPFGFDHPNNISQSPQIRNLSLCSFIWLPLILPLLCSNILWSRLLLNTLAIYSFLE